MTWEPEEWIDYNYWPGPYELTYFELLSHHLNAVGKIFGIRLQQAGLEFTRAFAPFAVVTKDDDPDAEPMVFSTNIYAPAILGTPDWVHIQEHFMSNDTEMIRKIAPLVGKSFEDLNKLIGKAAEAQKGFRTIQVQIDKENIGRGRVSDHGPRARTTFDHRGRRRY